MKRCASGQRSVPRGKWITQCRSGPFVNHSLEFPNTIRRSASSQGLTLTVVYLPNDLSGAISLLDVLPVSICVTTCFRVCGYLRDQCHRTKVTVGARWI